MKLIEHDDNDEVLALPPPPPPPSTDHQEKQAKAQETWRETRNNSNDQNGIDVINNVVGGRGADATFGVDGKVKESFAVVKKSPDPHEDFKRSMMEMILEKQMFEKDHLEELLQCFLSLNARQYQANVYCL
nr:transcription repressor OFP7-like [Ipomoea batatas]